MVHWEELQNCLLGIRGGTKTGDCEVQVSSKRTLGPVRWSRSLGLEYKEGREIRSSRRTTDSSQRFALIAVVHCNQVSKCVVSF